MPVPRLIIPIIMARYESVINNTEDIVVAISHMVVGLCSVTILPLASTYVCQRRAAMTSSSCAHLALPTETGGGRGALLLASRLTKFFIASGWTGDKMSSSVWDSPSNSGAPWGRQGGAGRRQEVLAPVCSDECISAGGLCLIHGFWLFVLLFLGLQIFD